MSNGIPFKRQIQNIQYARRSEGEQTVSLLKEIIAENLLNLGKGLDIKIHKANRSPTYLNVKRPSLGYMIMKMSKINDSIESSQKRK